MITQPARLDREQRDPARRPLLERRDRRLGEAGRDVVISGIVFLYTFFSLDLPLYSQEKKKSHSTRGFGFANIP